MEKELTHKEKRAVQIFHAALKRIEYCEHVILVTKARRKNYGRMEPRAKECIKGLENCIKDLYEMLDALEASL